MILICTSNFDFCKTVAKCIENLGHKYNILLTGSNRWDETQSFNGDSFSYNNGLLNPSIDLNNIKTVWFKLNSTIYSDQNTEYHEFIFRERKILTESFLFDLYKQKPFLVNNLDSQRIANNKIIQHQVAKSIGLNLPDTLVSSNYSEVVAFLEKHNEIIFKPLSYLSIPSENKILYANKIKKSQLDGKKDSIECVPNIFQQYINKKYEYRITVVGKDIFAFKIDSQANDSTKIDWRRDYSSFTGDVSVLSFDLENKIFKLMSELDLVTASIDMIEDEEGKFWFLEINPSGHWLWLDEYFNNKISMSHAKLLIKGAI